MRILVTGHKGFIGSRLFELLSRQVRPDGIDIKDGVDIVTYKAKAQYDIIVHTAALTSVVDSMKDVAGYFRTNAIGTWNLVRQHPEAHFIYLSTASIYGEGSDHTRNSEAKPQSVYAMTKLFGESCLRQFAKSCLILRLTNVIGEGERGEPNAYQIFEKAERIPIFGDGLQTRDFIHVDKVCEVILQMIFRPIVNVGSGVSKSILDVAKEFNKPIDFLPAREGEIRNFGIKDAFRLQ